MVSAVERFYTVIPPDLTYDQAHTLIAVRDFSRECAALVLLRKPSRIRMLYSRLIAVDTLNDEARILRATSWSEFLFNNCIERYDITAHPDFNIAATLCEAISAQLKAAGHDSLYLV
jgi:hypothetical protein